MVALVRPNSRDLLPRQILGRDQRGEPADPPGLDMATQAHRLGDTLSGKEEHRVVEVTRLVVALGGDAGTASGLAGLGDLVLTCTGDLSRNLHVGRELGRGSRLEDVLAGSRSVAEGVRTARSARDLARRTGIEMPIVEGVYRILYEDGSPQDGLERLLKRPLGPESSTLGSSS